MVGKGGFSLVFEIVKIDVDEVYDISRRSAIERRNVADQAVDEEGRPKFAVKMLRDDLMEDEHSKGVIDLAVEARFLRRLAHPHIVAMRATANSDPLESRFFVILEMLDGTLEGKITQWRREINKGISIWCGPLGYCCANKKVLSHTWLERFDVAKSIASALKYLHEEEIIYRDLKPENVGFSNGVVKLFDFGLSKRLLPDDRVANGLYRLTGNTGSLRYMAPEVALNQCYNTKADSYSFAIVLWQICSLTVPYAGYNVRRHADEVVAKGVRPKIARSWPVSWGEVMITCWQTDIHERLSFDHILDFLNDEYDILKKESDGQYVGQHVKDIRGKKKRKPDDFDINKTLDTDTRIIHEDDDGLQELELAERHHNVDFI
jgi:serine/threonine protein kinase